MLGFYPRHGLQAQGSFVTLRFQPINLSTGLRERVADVSSKNWFPQVPISLGAALFSVLHLILVFEQASGLYLYMQTPGSIRQDLVGISLSGISQLSISMFLLIMSVGLWFRSRIAFMLSVLVAMIGITNWYVLLDTPIGAGLFGFDILLLGFMLANYRSFNRSSMRLGTLAALAAVLVLFGYTMLSIYLLGDQFSPKIDTLPDAVYVTVVTMSTVGFGDFTPTTPVTRLLMTSVIFLSITVFSTAVGATLIPAIIHKLEQLTSRRRIRLTRNNHYIIVGYSTLSSNTYRELVSRNQHVTVILRHEPDSTQFSVSDLDIVIGDGGDLETLRKADAENAKAILALMDNDSENAFVILAAKELKVKAKTVAAVNDAKYFNRIRNVHPDIIIAPPSAGR